VMRILIAKDIRHYTRRERSNVYFPSRCSTVTKRYASLEVVVRNMASFLSSSWPELTRAKKNRCSFISP
jgi:hypothetical protein